MILKTKFSNNLKNTGIVFQSQLNLAVNKIEKRLISDAKKETPKDRGDAQAGFKGTHTTSGLKTLIKLTNTAPHFNVIEEGRAPGSKPPPASALFDWVERHGMEQSAAFPIARKIGRDGIKAKRPLQKALNKNKTFIQRAIEDAINKGVKQLNG